MRVFNRLLSKTLQDAGLVGKASRARDMVSSSAHPVSNLRLIRFAVNEEESEAERSYRIARSDLQNWNQRYWEKHNRDFYKEKEKYTKSELAKRLGIEGQEQVSQPTQQVLTHDELSLFYKKFLDDNHAKHFNYCRELYTRQFSLLGPAMNAFFSSSKRKVSQFLRRLKN